MKGLIRFREEMMTSTNRGLLTVVGAIGALMLALPAIAQDAGVEVLAQEMAEVAVDTSQAGKVDTGNDPRNFTSKFMPYYRHTVLKNGLIADDLAIFGMWALTKNFALTYETSLGSKVDIKDTAACAGLPDMDCTGSVPGHGYLPNGLPAEGDGVEVGMGDTILRAFWNIDKDTTLWGGAIIPGIQVTLPTANDPTLGSETVAGGPILTFVWDMKWWPAPGAFFAMMNIVEFDWYKDDGRDDVGRYIGRWFLQLPVNKKHKLYLLTEFQPVYDWEHSHFSFWFGPEFGKAFTPSEGIFRNGGAIYFKPGWGVSPSASAGDREWTFEVGFRFFFPSARDSYDMMTQGH